MQYKVRRLMEVLIYLYLIGLFVISPFYMKDNYNKLGRAKFELFRNNSTFFFGILLVLLLLYFVLAIKNKERKNVTIQTAFKMLSIPDKFVLAYFVFTLISFLASSYPENAFWGVKGWNMGFFSQIIFVLIYFFVSRFLAEGKTVILIAGLSTTIVYMLGILHRFLVDPLGIYEGLNSDLQIQFLSTLGQATWYSSFLCVCFPIGIGVYWFAKKWGIRLLAGIYIVVTMASLVTQNSDSAFFALGIVVLILFCLAFSGKNDMMRFVEISLLILFSFQMIGILQKIFWFRAVELEKISIFMSQSLPIKILFISLLVLYAVLLYCKHIDLEEWKFIRNAVLIVFVLAVIGTVIFIYCNTEGILYSKFGYQNEANYFLFDDNWGNGRGSSWKLAWKVLDELSFKDRIFGVGPDCFSFYAYDNPIYAQILQAKWGGSNLTNVHNEFLNSMICYGIFGVASYIGIFLSAFVRFIRNAKNESDHCVPVILGAALSVAAYVGHNFFCYQQVLCTPYLFIFLGMGEAVIRKLEKNKIFL